jgi:hypothetical protein
MTMNKMNITPAPAFMQAVRDVLRIDDLIPKPSVVIPALRDPVTGPVIDAAYRIIFDSHAGRVANEAAQRMREKLKTLKPEDLGFPGMTDEEVIASEWRSWFAAELAAEGDEEPRQSRTGKKRSIPQVVFDLDTGKVSPPPTVLRVVK